VRINKRVSLRKFTDDISRWVDEGRTDDWIASAPSWQKRWSATDRVELRPTPSRIVLLRR
jgi:hypothetical protein